VACIRLYAPQGSKFKYELTIGRASDGLAHR